MLDKYVELREKGLTVENGGLWFEILTNDRLKLIWKHYDPDTGERQGNSNEKDSKADIETAILALRVRMAYWEEMYLKAYGVPLP